MRCFPRRNDARPINIKAFPIDLSLPSAHFLRLNSRNGAPVPVRPRKRRRAANTRLTRTFPLFLFYQTLPGHCSSVRASAQDILFFPLSSLFNLIYSTDRCEHPSAPPSVVDSAIQIENNAPQIRIKKGNFERSSVASEQTIFVCWRSRAGDGQPIEIAPLKRIEADENSISSGRFSGKRLRTLNCGNTDRKCDFFDFLSTFPWTAIRKNR